MKNKAFAVLLGALLGVLTTFGIGLDHRAMAAYNDCPVGQFCWWANTNYSGPWGHRTWSDIWDNPGSCWSMGASGNTMSSFRNRGTGSYFSLTDDGGCQTPLYTVYPDEANSNMVGIGINNVVGGVWWLA